MQKNSEEFTKKELMLMVFGADGAVPGLNKRINKLCSSIDNLNKDIAQVRKDIKEYNGLKKSILDVTTALSDHKKFCADKQLQISTAEKTELKIAERIAKERAEARKDERDAQNLRYAKQLRLIKFGALLIAGVAVLLTFGGMFLW